ncbi:hypothetical protein CPB85DRAFT_1241987, partial [Mucidula mucida]
FHTGRWWWDTQKAVEARSPGATIIPIILSSDKTQITLFHNKTAYPVYLTIGNLPKDIRQKPSRHGQVLLAYLPTTKLEHIKNKAARRRALANLFHASLSRVLTGLKEAGINGVVMHSGNGVARRCHPIFASYVSDYPEQVLVTCTYSGNSPLCEVPANELGDYPCDYEFCSFEEALSAAESIGTPDWGKNCAKANIKPVQYPFWEDLPYVDIFRSITPNILHQLLQGVMKHLIGWITKIVGKDKLDAHVRRLPPNHLIRIFFKGLSSLSQVSGTEHKQICAFILGMLNDLLLPPDQLKALVCATRALLDFLYLSRYQVHSDITLQELNDCLEEFHSNKWVFVECGVREHFNIPKLHFLTHYICAIKLFGTANNYSTETTERLHIDFTKDAYPEQAVLRPSSRQDVARANIRFLFADLSCPYNIKMTNWPTLKSVRISTLQTSYGASLFVPALCRFIAQFCYPTGTAAQIEEAALDVALPFRSVPVFHCIKFINTDFHPTETLDSIHAYPQIRTSSGKITREGRFDTALIRVRAAKDVPSGVYDGLEFLLHSRLRVGRVRIVYSLPPQSLPKLVPPNVEVPEHLAYVKWYSRLTLRPDETMNMQYICREHTGDGSPLVSVLLVSVIESSVHLFPKWGKAVPAECVSD